MDILSDVLVEPNLALRRLRVCAGIIDFILVAIVGYLIAILVDQTNPAGGAWGFHLEGWPALLWFGASFALVAVQEGLTGKTIGQRLLKIKVVSADTLEVSVGASIVRHLFDVVDCFLLIGLIISCCNKKKQRIGDLVARTIVVNGI
jgi:uncharacterized RDD family membrane protein YckC